MLRVCIVGYGRAGRIQHDASKGILEVTDVVDERASVSDTLDMEASSFHTSSWEVTRRSDIDAVLITTPTSSHFSLCREALENRKHVLVEKPIAVGAEQIATLYELARKNRCLLYTAYNRRCDPKWAELIAAIGESRPLHVNVVCRDHPVPPAPYLETCGGIFRDAAVHDIDMMCVMLKDTPVRVTATLDASKETASTLLHFSKGCQVRMVHSRHAPRYDQRVWVFCNDRAVEMDNAPVTDGKRFQDRYRDSYVALWSRRAVHPETRAAYAFDELTGRIQPVKAADVE